MDNLYTHKDSNIAKTWALMAGFMVLIVAVGWVFGQVYQSRGLVYGAVVLSLIMNAVAYWKSDKIALASSHAKLIPREGNERIYRIVENLCITAGLPQPPIYIIPGMQINAFATGRNPEHSAIAVTEGALAKLNDNELTGVLAHELSHVGNRDILVSSIMVVLAGVISMLSDWFLHIGLRGRDSDNRSSGPLAVVAIVMALLAPLAAMLIQFSVSRKREYLADASGALLTRYPEGLASALEKIQADSSSLPFASNATAHLFLSNPFKSARTMSWIQKMFSTHPPVEDRIRILRDMNPVQEKSSQSE